MRACWSSLLGASLGCGPSRARRPDAVHATRDELQVAVVAKNLELLLNVEPRLDRARVVLGSADRLDALRESPGQRPRVDFFRGIRK
jgi:hypothetical protein